MIIMNNIFKSRMIFCRGQLATIDRYSAQWLFSQNVIKFCRFRKCWPLRISCSSRTHQGHRIHCHSKLGVQDTVNNIITDERKIQKRIKKKKHSNLCISVITFFLLLWTHCLEEGINRLELVGLEAGGKVRRPPIIFSISSPGDLLNNFRKKL